MTDPSEPAPQGAHRAGIAPAMYGELAHGNSNELPQISGITKLTVPILHIGWTVPWWGWLGGGALILGVGLLIRRKRRRRR